MEGTFEGGYFVSVQVDGTSRLYRGVVFVPGVAVNVNEQKDVAPEAPVVSPMTASRTTPFTPPHPALRPPASAAEVSADAAAAAATADTPRAVSHGMTSDSTIPSPPDASGAPSAQATQGNGGDAATLPAAEASVTSATIAPGAAVVPAAAVLPADVSVPAGSGVPAVLSTATPPSDPCTHADQTIQPQGSPPVAEATAEPKSVSADEAMLGSPEVVPAAAVAVAAATPPPAAVPMATAATGSPPHAVGKVAP